MTTRTRVTLAIARRIAAARGDNDLSDLLLAILRDAKNPVALALARRDFAVQTALAPLQSVFNITIPAPPTA
ncbi:MAG: hypothetical protein ABJE47_23500 [bacterium]